MRETGEVTAVTGGSVTVRIKRTSACAHCKACDFGLQSDEMRVTAQNACGALPGDTVRVELRTESFLSAALILYGIPLAGMLAGFTVGHYLGIWLELAQFAALTGFGGGLVMAALAYAFIKKSEPRWRAGHYTPVATEVVDINTHSAPSQ